MTPDDIAADRAVIDAAIGGPGPWTAPGYEVWVAFIAAARTGWPRALDALEAAQAEAELARITVAEDAGLRIMNLAAEVERLCAALEAAQEDNDRLGAMVEWQAEVIVDARDACQRAESIEPTGSPEWVESGIAMRTTVLREIREAMRS